MATITKKQGSQVGIAFGFAALSSAIIVAGTPWLFQDSADRSTFLIFWSVLFTFAGVLTGLNFEVTRTIAAATAGVVDQRPTPLGGPRVVLVAGAIGLALSALLALASPWWATWQFPTQPQMLALAVALGVAGLGFYHGTGGALAGSGQWGRYARLVFADSALRVLLVVGIVLATHSVVGAALGSALAFFIGLGFLVVVPAVRPLASLRTADTMKSLLFRFGAAALASGSSALLVMGFPALLALTTPPEIIEVNDPLLMALTLTRAPLMIPLNAVQGIVISHFSRATSFGFRTMWPILRIALAVGAIAATLAWLLGPWLLTNIWGPEFYVSGPILGALTAGATGLAVVSLTGSVCQSLTLHRSFVLGWLAAVVSAIGLLTLPLPLASRAALALGIGPVVGIVVHLVALFRAGERHRSS